MNVAANKLCGLYFDKPRNQLVLYDNGQHVCTVTLEYILRRSEIWDRLYLTGTQKRLVGVVRQLMPNEGVAALPLLEGKPS